MPEEIKTLIDTKEEDDKSKRSTTTPRLRSLIKRRNALAKITLLDDSILDVYVERKASGQDLLDKICETLNILEKDYFGLAYDDKSDKPVWMDPNKCIAKFLKNYPWKLYFRIKFYPPEPAILQEDLTRYQLCLQIRNDLLTTKLPCSFITYSLLGSYLVQSELGDYDDTEMGPDYLKNIKLAPNQSSALEEKVMELHKTHKGQTPAEAELNYLENAKKLPLYGVDLHSARDSEGVDIELSVCSSGIIIYREKLKINRFAWPKILKISFKRHNFYIKIRPGLYEQFEATVSFKLADRHAAKKLWKVCVEQHTFFRLMTPAPVKKSVILPRFGSRFRYSGRTLYECKNDTIDRIAPQFQRTLSGSRINIKAKDDKHDDKDSKRHTLPHPPKYLSDVDAVKPKISTVKDKKNNKKSKDESVKESAVI